jgi:tetratricopeptide (TPR) repeat protein
MNRRERRRMESLGEAGASASTAKAVNAAKARVRAAETRLDKGDTAGALASLKEAQTLDPQNARAWYLQAMIELNAGRITEAGDAILKASLIDDKDLAIHANCAAIMNLCGRPMEAEASARFVIERSPEMPEAYCNLGVALEAQGKVADAREALTRAIDLKPGYADALISLGNLWFRAGDYISAAESFAEAVKAGPMNVMAKTNLAVALRHVGELAAAEQQCLEAIGIDQGYAEAYNALGNVLLQLGDVPGAIKAFEDAVQRRAVYPEARANLAGARFKAGDLKGAEEGYQDVLERHPEFAEAALGLGIVLLGQGRLADAERRFRRAVEIRPSMGEAWMNIADARGADLADEDLAVLRTRAADARLPEEDRIAFLYALGSAEDAKGDYAAAFAAYRQANERRSRLAEITGAAFSADEFDDEITNVINTLNKSSLELVKDMGDAEAELIFICGMPRSGTTLVEQILAVHPDVAGMGEVDILSGLPDDYPAEVPGLTAAEIRSMAETYLSRLPVRPCDGKRVTDKTPQNVFFLGLIQVLFPKAKVIHCRRDPRDVALSCYFQNFHSVGLDWASDLGNIRRYAAAEERIMAHWRETLDIAIHEVVYEDLVADHEAETRKLLDFCGLAWNDAVLRPHERTGTVLTASNWQVRKPIHTNAVQRWRHYEGFLGDG